MGLIECSECRRHVFSHERACPFCGASVPRARAIGVAVATALALGACSAPKYGGPPPPDVDSPRLQDTSAAPVESAPAPDATASASATPQPILAPAYGAPPPQGEQR